MDSNSSRTSSVLSNVDTNVANSKTSKTNSPHLSTRVKNIASEKRNVTDDDQENKSPENTEEFVFKKPLSKETMPKEDATLNTLIDGLNYLKLGESSEPEKRFNLFKWTTPIKKQTYPKEESSTHAHSSIQNQSLTVTLPENDKDSKSQSDDANSEYYDCSDEENSTQVDTSNDHLNTTGSSFHSVQEKDKQDENEIASSDSELVSEARVAEMNLNQQNDDSFMIVKYLENTFSIDDEHFKLELTMSDVSCRDRTLAAKISEESELECTLNNTIDDQGNRISTPCQSPSDEEIEQTVQDVNQSIERVLLLEDAPVESNILLKDPLSMELEVNENRLKDEIVESTEEYCSSETSEIENPQHDKTISEHETSIRNMRKSEIFPLVELVENGSFIKPESLEISLPYINDPFNVSIGTLDNLSPQLIFNSKTVPEPILNDEIEEIEEIYGGLLEEGLKENRSEEHEISVTSCDAINAENPETGKQMENINVSVGDARVQSLNEVPVNIFNDRTDPENDEVEVNQADRSEETPNVTFDANGPFEITGVIENIRFNHFGKPAVVQTSPKNQVEFNESCEGENTHLDENDEHIPEPLDITFDANDSTKLNDAFDVEVTGAIENINDDYFKNPIFEANFEANESTRLIDNTECGLDSTSPEPNETIQLEATRVLDDTNSEHGLSESFNANDSAFQLEATRELDASNVKSARKSLDVTLTINASFESNEISQLEDTRVLNDTDNESVRKSLDVTSTINASFEPNESYQLEATRVLNDTGNESVRKSLDVTSTINASFESNEISKLEATRVLNETGNESVRKSLDVTSTINASFEPNEAYQLEATCVLNDTDNESVRKSLNVTSTINASFEPNETYQLEATCVLNETDVESALKSLDITREPETTCPIEVKQFELCVSNSSTPPENKTLASVEPIPESGMKLNSTFPITQEYDDMRMEIDEDYPELETTAMSVCEHDTIMSAINGSKVPVSECHEKVLYNELSDKWNTLSDLSVLQQEGEVLNTTPLNSSNEMDETSPLISAEIEVTYEMKSRGMFNDLEVIPESNENESLDEQMTTPRADINLVNDKQVEARCTSVAIKELNFNDTTIVESPLSTVASIDTERSTESNMANDAHEEVQMASPESVDLKCESTESNMANDAHEEVQMASSESVDLKCENITSPITLTADEKSPTCNTKDNESDSSSSTIEANPSSPKEIELNTTACSPVVPATDSTPTSDELPQKDDFSAFKTPNRPKLLVDSSFNADYCASKTPVNKSAIKNSLISPRCSFSDRNLYSPFGISARTLFKGTPKASGDVSTNLLDMSIGFFQQFTTKTASNNASFSQAPEDNPMNRTVDVDEEPRTEETKLLIIEELKMINVKTQTHDSELEDLKTENTNLKNELAQKQKEFQDVLELAQKLHHNVVALQEANKQYEDNQRKLENRYELLKEYSNELLVRRNEELDQLEMKYGILLKKWQEKSAESEK